MTQFQDTIKNLYPNVPVFSHEVDMAVAKGAAVYAKMLSEERRHVNREFLFRTEKKTEGKTLKRVSSRTYGIVAYVDDVRKVCNMIMKNETIPYSKEEIYYTRYAGQKQVSLEVYESIASDRYEEISRATAVGKCYLDINGELPQNSPISVELRLNEDGTLWVRGSEPSGDTEITATMKTLALMSPDELSAASEQVEEIYTKVV